MKSVASIIGEKGGGSETNAQASGVKVDKLSEAMEAAKQYIHFIENQVMEFIECNKAKLVNDY